MSGLAHDPAAGAGESGAGNALAGLGCLVAGGDGALAERVAAGLTAAGARVVRASPRGGRGAAAEASGAATEAGPAGSATEAEPAAPPASRADAERIAADAADRVSTLSALVCLPPPAESIAFADLGPAAFDATVDAAFRSPFLLTQAMLPRLRAAGRGRLVYVTSTLAISGRPETAHTAAAEHAVVGLMRTATLETEPPLTANAIATSVDPAVEDVDRLVDLLTLVLRSGSDYLTGQILKTAGGAELHV